MRKTLLEHASKGKDLNIKGSRKALGKKSIKLLNISAKMTFSILL
jgi:hypothetical protein